MLHLIVCESNSQESDSSDFFTQNVEVAWIAFQQDYGVCTMSQRGLISYLMRQKNPSWNRLPAFSFSENSLKLTVSRQKCFFEPAIRTEQS